MENAVKFFHCEECDGIFELVEGDGSKLSGCGGSLKEIKPNTSEGAGEKHIPEVEVQGNVAIVKVGSVLHPMVAEHYIGWVILDTNKGVYRKNLEAGEEPVAKFLLSEGETVSSVYAYCNEHGLWKR